MKIGDVEIDKKFFGDKYRVLVEEKDNLRKFIEFQDWENTKIFSEIIKIKDALGLNNGGKE